MIRFQPRHLSCHVGPKPYVCPRAQHCQACHATPGTQHTKWCNATCMGKTALVLLQHIPYTQSIILSQSHLCKAPTHDHQPTGNPAASMHLLHLECNTHIHIWTHALLCMHTNVLGVTMNGAPYVGSHRQQSQAQHTRGHTQSALYARNHQTVQTLQHAAPHMQVCAGSWQQNMPGAPCSHVPLAGH